MTDQRIQTVRNLYETFRQQDLQSTFALNGAGAEMTQTDLLTLGGHLKGQQEAAFFVMKLTQKVRSTVSLDAVFPAGDKVVAIGRTQGSVNATGQAFDVVVSHVYTFGADNNITKTEYYIDSPAMLAAL